MKLHGYCETCHKIKRVRVTSAVIARMAARGGSVPIGKCDDCQEKEDQRRKGNK